MSRPSKTPVKTPVSKQPKNLAEWTAIAECQLKQLLKKTRSEPLLFKKAAAENQWQVEIRMVGAAHMRTLNRSYRGKDYPTDVLSFPAPEVFRRQGVLGELVICVPVLKRQAAEQGHSAEQELSVLLVHGVLHLLGFDHELGPKQAKVMRDWEARILGVRLSGRGLIERAR
jgi:probable rRNA maturation factor